MSPPGSPLDAAQDARADSASETLLDAPVDVALDVTLPPPTAPPSNCDRALCAAPLPSSGASVALGDLDGDGLVEVLLFEAGPLFRDAGAPRLFRNLGGMRFQEETALTPLRNVTGWGAVFCDLDNDGDQDLALGGRRPGDALDERGRVMVFENVHGALRERVGAIPDGGEGVPLSLHVADFDDDGVLDLVAATAGTDETLEYHDRVLLSAGPWSWRDGPTPDARGATWVTPVLDLDDDGHTDLLVANDPFVVAEAPRSAYTQPGVCDPAAAENHVGAVNWWRNGAYLRRVDADGALRWERRRLHTAFDAEPGPPYMGIAVADLNADRRWDLYCTDVGAPSLFVSSGERDYEEYSRSLRLRLWGEGASERDAVVLWSALFHDLDLDGDEDLLVTAGTLPDSTAPARDNVLQRREGLFFSASEGASVGLTASGSWSGLAMADLDRDGDRDFVLTPQGIFGAVCEPRTRSARSLRNDTPALGRHRLVVRLVGTVSNRDGIGARVEIPWRSSFQSRTVGHGGNMMATGTPEVEFGLAEVTEVAEVRVRWPDGTRQVVPAPGVDRTVTVTQPRWFTAEPTPTGAVTVRAARAVGDDLALTLLGDARWERAPERTADTLEATLRGRGRVGVVASAPSSSVRAVRWLSLP